MSYETWPFQSMNRCHSREEIPSDDRDLLGTNNVRVTFADTHPISIVRPWECNPEFFFNRGSVRTSVKNLWRYFFLKAMEVYLLERNPAPTELGCLFI
ncbi:unnamed protein product [Prunus armeniaca]